MCKRLLQAMLCLLLLLGNSHVYARTNDTSDVVTSKERKDYSQYPRFYDEDEVIEYVRQQLYARNQEIIVVYLFEEGHVNRSWLGEILADENDPKAGYYLRHHMYNERGSGTTTEIDGVRYNVATIKADYRSTCEQEAQVDAFVAEFLQGIDSNASEFDRFMYAYKYLTENVEYRFNTYEMTAYGALVMNQCVCSGYSIALYRLCRELGLDVVYVTGDAGTEEDIMPHAWNIIRLDGNCYFTDATWDVDTYHGQFLYCLRSEDNFPYHYRDEEYLTDDFISLYPISETDYPVFGFITENPESEVYSLYNKTLIIHGSCRTTGYPVWESKNKDTGLWEPAGIGNYRDEKEAYYKITANWNSDEKEVRLAVYDSADKNELLAASTSCIIHVSEAFYQMDWNWSDDYSSCTCEFLDDQRNEVNINCNITTEYVASTCLSYGQIIYTATCELGGKTYTDVRTVNTEKLDHEYTFDSFCFDGYNGMFYYRCSVGNETEYVRVNATIVGQHATCYESGRFKLVADLTAEQALDGIPRHFESEEIEEDPLGHDYVTSWNWADDCSSATVDFICSRDPSHRYTLVAETHYEGRTESRCYVKDKYMGELWTEDGGYYIDYHYIVISENHEYEVIYEWSDDYMTVTAINECTRCYKDESTETVNTVIEVIEPATCTEEGEGIFTATFTNSIFETQSRTANIPALGHDWGDWVYDGAEFKTHTHTCTHDNSHTETENCVFDNGVVNGNVKTYTCQVCGGTYTETVEEPVVIQGSALVLEGVIQIQFRVIVPDAENKKVVIKFEGEKESNSYEESYDAVERRHHTAETDQGTEYYYRVSVYAKQMNDKVTIWFTDLEGNRVSFYRGSGVDVTESGYEYSVATYINNMWNSSKEKTRNLVRAMKYYGLYAQKEFDYEVSLADEILSTLEPMQDVEASELEMYAKQYEGEAPDGLSLAGYSMTLTDDVRINYRLEVGEGVNPKTYEIRVDGVKVTAKKSGSNWYVYKKNIVAKDLDTMHELSISDGTKTIVYRYGVLTYCYNKISSDDTRESLKNLCKAIYWYSKAADAYWGN